MRKLGGMHACIADVRTVLAQVRRLHSGVATGELGPGLPNYVHTHPKISEHLLKSFLYMGVSRMYFVTRLSLLISKDKFFGPPPFGFDEGRRDCGCSESMPSSGMPAVSCSEVGGSPTLNLRSTT